MDHADAAIRGEMASAATAAAMLRDIAAVRPEIASLSTESNNGAARSAAARTAIVDLVSVVSLTRLLALLPAGTAPLLRSTDSNDGPSTLPALCRRWLGEELRRKSADIQASLDALRSGTHPQHAWRTPLYRSRRIAAESGVRAAIQFMLIATFFVVTGWPMTELCLTLAAVIIGLSATAPDPRMFTGLAVLSTSLACLLAGILKYFIFNGVSDFQLLAIGLAPVVIGLALLISLPSRLWSPIGRLTLVFTLAIFMPTNPQSYDPLTFVITCLFSILSSTLVFAAQLLIPPVSSGRRLQLLLDELHREPNALDVRRHSQLAPDEALFRDATRIEQIVTASGPASPQMGAIDEALRSFDRAAAVRRSRADLAKLMSGPLVETATIARAALAARDSHAILRAAEELRIAATALGVNAAAACAGLVLAAFALAPPQVEAGTIEERQP
jgi:hypothetical protein